MSRRLEVASERFPTRGTFAISRGSRTEIEVVTATIREGELQGRGECAPYGRYGESVASVVALIESQRALIEEGYGRVALQTSLPPGAARNALDCALFDLEAKLAGRPAWELARLAAPQPVTTCLTLSLGPPEAMAKAAEAAADRPLLKVKLGGDGDLDRIRAVRAAAPATRLIVDANEAWRRPMVERYLAAMAECGVEMVEQPLPAGDDALLGEVPHPVPVGADESAHASDSLATLVGRYDIVNLKLDKTGGLTEALRFAAEAERLGLGLMVGCMLGTSLSMAPAILVAQRARFVDLDGPLLLARDRQPGLRYVGSELHPAQPELWG